MTMYCCGRTILWCKWALVCIFRQGIQLAQVPWSSEWQFRADWAAKTSVRKRPLETQELLWFENLKFLSVSGPSSCWWGWQNCHHYSADVGFLGSLLHKHLMLEFLSWFWSSDILFTKKSWKTSIWSSFSTNATLNKNTRKGNPAHCSHLQNPGQRG